MITFTPWEYVLIALVFAWPLYALIAGLATWVRMQPTRFSGRLRTIAVACQIVFIPAFVAALVVWISFEFYDPSGKFYDALHRRTLTAPETIEGVELPVGALVHYRYGMASWVDFDRPATVGGIRVLHASAYFANGLHWQFYQDMRVDVASQDVLVADGCVFTKTAANGQAYLLMQITQPPPCDRALSAAAQ
jgi:hypothetical protein